MRSPALFVLLLTTLLGCSQDHNEKKPDRSGIDSLFNRMEATGIAVDGALLYGFFFVDHDTVRLAALNKELLTNGLRHVRTEPNGDGTFLLHVEEVTIHSRNSLAQRQEQLVALAAKHRVETYDGWDVGNADANIPLPTRPTDATNITSPEETYGQALALYDAERYKEAISLFQTCIARQYRVDTCLYKQAVGHAMLGDPAKAIERFELVVDNEPRYLKAWFGLGASNYDALRFEASSAAYRKALELDPTNADIHYGIAASEFAMGNMPECKARCKAALKLEPDHANATNLLARLP